MKLSRRLAALSVAAPLALALSACGGTEDPDSGDLDGEPIAAIPAPDGQAWTDVVTVTEEDGYLVGNPDAPLKLVEYASHTCGGCANFAQNGVEPLKNQYVSSGVVSFELRNLVRDPVDLTIATLVRCGQPESMQPLSDQAWVAFNEVMGNVSAAGEQIQATSALPLEERFVRIAEVSGLIDFFAARGLSADQARTCLADAETIENIANTSQAQAQELNINVTPTFLLNGRKLDANQWPQLEPLLQRAGAR